jgi:FkbM family methyltransferase
MEMNQDFDYAGMSPEKISSMWYQIYKQYDYDWWYEIQPSDVVLDIGAGNGMFAKKALDAGAGKVYMVEPNRRILRAAIHNCSDHLIDIPPYSRVYPICATMGKDIDSSSMYQNPTYKAEPEPQVLNLQELITGFEIPIIDYLRVDTWGAEYNILSKEMLWLFTSHVKFAAVRITLGQRYNSHKVFERWRDSFLSEVKEKLLFKDERMLEWLWDDDWKDKVPHTFMMYIKNW